MKRGGGENAGEEKKRGREESLGHTHTHMCHTHAHATAKKKKASKAKNSPAGVLTDIFFQRREGREICCFLFAVQSAAFSPPPLPEIKVGTGRKHFMRVRSLAFL